jgi:hypothetical protein
MIRTVWVLTIIIAMISLRGALGADVKRATVAQNQSFILVGASAGRSIITGDGIWSFAAQQASPQNLLLNGSPVGDKIVMISIQGSKLHALDAGDNESIWNGSAWTAFTPNWVAPGFDPKTRQPIDVRDGAPIRAARLAPAPGEPLGRRLWRSLHHLKAAISNTPHP